MTRLQNASTSSVLLERNHDNLFVRLSPDLLSTLVVTAQTAPPSEIHDWRRQAGSNGWILLESESHITFLPLEITVGNITLYGSYNGGLLDGYTGKQKFVLKTFRCQMQTHDDSVYIIVTTSEQIMWMLINCCLPSEVVVCV